MVTKEQERKALQKIKNIVDGLGGEDSYIGMAFAGCFEMAEQNINNDWGCSMKQKVESAENNAQQFMKTVKELGDKLEAAKSEVERVTSKLEEMQKYQLTYSDHLKCREIIKAEADNCEYEAESQAKNIVKFADTPSSNEFVKAVSRHRSFIGKAKQLNELLERLNLYIEKIENAD